MRAWMNYLRRRRIFSRHRSRQRCRSSFTTRNSTASQTSRTIHKQPRMMSRELSSGTAIFIPHSGPRALGPPHTPLLSPRFALPLVPRRRCHHPGNSLRNSRIKAVHITITNSIIPTDTQKAPSHSTHNTASFIAPASAPVLTTTPLFYHSIASVICCNSSPHHQFMRSR